MRQHCSEIFRNLRNQKTTGKDELFMNLNIFQPKTNETKTFCSSSRRPSSSPKRNRTRKASFKASVSNGLIAGVAYFLKKPLKVGAKAVPHKPKSSKKKKNQGSKKYRQCCWMTLPGLHATLVPALRAARTV